MEDDIRRATYSSLEVKDALEKARTAAKEAIEKNETRKQKAVAAAQEHSAEIDSAIAKFKRFGKRPEEDDSLYTTEERNALSSTGKSSRG